MRWRIWLGAELNNVLEPTWSLCLLCDQWIWSLDWSLSGLYSCLVWSFQLFCLSMEWEFLFHIVIYWKCINGIFIFHEITAKNFPWISEETLKFYMPSKLHDYEDFGNGIQWILCFEITKSHRDQRQNVLACVWTITVRLICFSTLSLVGSANFWKCRYLEGED